MAAEALPPITHPADTVGVILTVKELLLLDTMTVLTHEQLLASVTVTA